MGGRFQQVKLGDSISTPLRISAGVLQGSILGPLLIAIKTSQIPCVVKSSSVCMYAHDKQLYQTSHPSNLQTACEAINGDLEMIYDVFTTHCLIPSAV